MSDATGCTLHRLVMSAVGRLPEEPISKPFFFLNPGARARDGRPVVYGAALSPEREELSQAWPPALATWVRGPGCSRAGLRNSVSLAEIWDLTSRELVFVRVAGYGRVPRWSIRADSEPAS